MNFKGMSDQQYRSLQEARQAKATDAARTHEHAFTGSSLAASCRRCGFNRSELAAWGLLR